MTREGYQVDVARDGGAALEFVKRHPPDIVLLDLNMPVLDGLEVCRRLKADPATCLIPVMIITGENGPSDHIRSIAAGADDFLTKPFILAELVARVRSLTRAIPEG